MNNIFIFGTGGFAKEVYWLAKDCGYNISAFVDIRKHDSIYNTPIILESEFNHNDGGIVLGVGNPNIRKLIYEKYCNFYFPSLIHPSVKINESVKIANGAVICKNCILTCDIVIGVCCQLNLSTTVGHDCSFGNFFTTAPGVHISGNVQCDELVYFGTNSSSLEHINITKNVIIGASACVTKNLEEPGIYIGIPAKRKIEV